MECLIVPHANLPAGESSQWDVLLSYLYEYFLKGEYIYYLPKRHTLDLKAVARLFLDSDYKELAVDELTRLALDVHHIERLMEGISLSFWQRQYGNDLLCRTVKRVKRIGPKQLVIIVE